MVMTAGATIGIANNSPEIPDPTAMMTSTMPRFNPSMYLKPRLRPNAEPTAARLRVLGPGLPVRAKAAIKKPANPSNALSNINDHR